MRSASGGSLAAAPSVRYGLARTRRMIQRDRRRAAGASADEQEAADVQEAARAAGGVAVAELAFEN